MIFATYAPADGHMVYSVGLGHTGAKAHVNGCEVPCVYDPGSGQVTLQPGASYFDASSGSLIAGHGPVKHGDSVEIRFS